MGVRLKRKGNKSAYLFLRWKAFSGNGSGKKSGRDNSIFILHFQGKKPLITSNQTAPPTWFPDAPKVFMITAYDDEQNRRGAQEAGCDGYITKPINFETLKQQILNAV
jgi:hypothetical protein